MVMRSKNKSKIKSENESESKIWSKMNMMDDELRDEISKIQKLPYENKMDKPYLETATQVSQQRI